VSRQCSNALDGSAERSTLRLLWIGTKPPTPADDGGRVVARLTLEALAAAGADITVVVPGAPVPTPNADPAVAEPWTTLLVDAPPRAWVAAAGLSLVTGGPLTLARHARPRLRRRVSALLAEHTFDVVHVEQVQALASAAPALDAGVPVVMRIHNIEHQVWASGEGAWARVMATEAERLGRAEGTAFGRVDHVVALSHEDAAACQRLAPSTRVAVVPPPIAVGTLGRGPRLDGGPACVWLGSAGWAPNTRAQSWLFGAVWPAIVRRLPSARLHAFGAMPQGPGIRHHRAPADATDAFAEGSILLLPLRTATGVRLRLLEAWARGVPVVATPDAAAGLAAVHGQNVLIADTPDAFADAVAAIASDSELRQHLVANGLRTVARDHNPAVVASALLDVYRQAIARHRASGPIGG
jgi:hypothetical protein